MAENFGGEGGRRGEGRGGGTGGGGWSYELETRELVSGAEGGREREKGRG